MKERKVKKIFTKILKESKKERKGKDLTNVKKEDKGKKNKYKYKIRKKEKWGIKQSWDQEEK